MSSGVVTLGGEVVILAPFVEARVLDASAVHVAALIARTVGAVEPDVVLGAALAARAPLFGQVCVVIDSVAASIFVDDAQGRAIDSLPWPDPGRWASALSRSAAVRGPGDDGGEETRPLVWDGTRLYLERYWRYEQRIGDDLLRRARSGGGLGATEAELDHVLDDLFPLGASRSPDRQREAVSTALCRRIAIVAGGPGTGKTRTIARLLAAAHELARIRGRQLEVALAAPTGKAAARMTQAVHEQAEGPELSEVVAEALGAAQATTVHRLLGLDARGRPRYDRFEPLPHDLVVVDETSMVSLPLMARLLDAVRPEATVVLVGDPFQLASVEAGAAFGEIVGPEAGRTRKGPLASDVVLLEQVHRYRTDSAIAALASAVRLGDDDRVVDILRGNRTDELGWVEDDDQAGIEALRADAAVTAVEVVRAARAGEAETGLRLASDLKVLCATRLGSLGVLGWGAAIETLVAGLLPDAGLDQRWYVGRPVIVTRNDYFNRVFNGDVGLVVAGPNRPFVAVPDHGGVRALATSQLGDVDTWWATTIHKSQGSEFESVIVSLARPASPILTRELLYTAITRARQRVTLVASESAVRAAVTRSVARASGLGQRLWP